MKQKENNILINHICKTILVESPTIDGLEAKLKHYKQVLIQIITNGYQLYNLTLEDENIHFNPSNGRYQTIMFFNFSGKKKDIIDKPEEILEHIKELEMLEDKTRTTSRTSKIIHKLETYHTKSITIETEHLDRIDEIISKNKKVLIEQLLSNNNLTYISFGIGSRRKENDKIIITLPVEYKCRELPEHTLTNEHDR